MFMLPLWWIKILIIIWTQERRAKERLEQKRERKAARTLAVITGSFVCCWLPFFIVALVRPFCADRCLDLPPLAQSVIDWLGYFNSLLNPIIYTVFNPDFRSAFRKILYGKYRRRSNTRWIQLLLLLLLYSIAGSKRLYRKIIYTVFNPDFRSAFRKILYGKYRRRSNTRRRRPPQRLCYAPPTCTTVPAITTDLAV